jgi:integrase
MATFKRGKTWWTDFTQDSVRYRESLRTTNWQEALRREKNRIAEVASGRGLASHRQFAKWPFDKAVAHYLESRKLHLAARSIAKERELLSHPKRYFGSLPLVRLTPEMVREYLVKRKADGLSNATLNMVSGALRRLLKMAKRWHLFAEDVKRLPEESHIGRALTAAELSGLLKLAETRPEWATLRGAVVLAVNTTMRSQELKNLRWQDVDLFDRILTVRHAKTEAGKRVIPLNEDALFAMLGLLKQAQTAGADAADHFVFPACENGTIDPLKPQKSWRTAWRSLTRGIHCPACGEFQSAEPVCRNEKCKADNSKVKSPTAGLRFHDLRHTAITILAESNASEQTVMSIAGHVSRKMLEHYSHIRMDAKRHAVAALMAPKALPAGEPDYKGIVMGYDTNHGTTGNSEGTTTLQLTESNGGPGWT